MREWNDLQGIYIQNYICGYCGKVVASNSGYEFDNDGIAKMFHENIAICPNCDKPTYLKGENGQLEQVPNCIDGMEVLYINDEEVENLYEEARKCMSIKAYTASALCSRKLLMNIAVKKGAKEGNSFKEYIEWLNEHGYTPPESKPWVDKIRVTGNVATHKINIISREEASISLKFVGIILKFIYEFPAIMNNSVK